jgi:hypothetical protein
MPRALCPVNLQPGDREERDAVAEFRHVDVRRCEVGAAPHLGGRFDAIASLDAVEPPGC